MKYSLQEIAKIVNAKLEGGSNSSVSQNIFDSRNISHTDEAVFWAFKGKIDGNQFIAEAYEKGVRNFISDITIDLPEDAQFIVVDNTHKALQELAKHHLEQLELKTIGITGSNGKTIVKEWLFQCLFEEDNIIRSPKSYNSQIGLPISILEAENEHNLGIFEVGISKPGEMQKLQSVFHPDIGVLTNVRESHLDNFTNYTQLVHEKLLLFQDTPNLVYNVELEEFITLSQFEKSLSFGPRGQVNVISVKKIATNSYKVEIQLLESVIHIETSFNDKASLENLTAVAATLLLMGYSTEFIENKIQHLHAIEMRLEIKTAYQNSILVKDEFSLDYPSLEIALNVLDQQMKPNNWAILSDFDSESMALQKKESVVELLNSKNFQHIIFVGTQFQEIRSDFKMETTFYPNTEKLLENLDSFDIKDAAILIKGARKFGLEVISERLEAQSHETIMEVSLHKMIENLNHYKSLLNKDTEVMAMVKANAYGCGLVPVSKNLQHFGIDYFGVAYADEGEQLRKAGIYKPIMVMNSDTSGFHKIIENSLEPEIYSFRVLEKFLSELKRKSINKPYPIHIKIDTGMHRLGFPIDQISELAQVLTGSQYLKVVSVFTHLSSASDTSEKAFTLAQIQKFENAYNELTQGLKEKPKKHVLNTSGVINYVDYQFDMVRLGIGLYTQFEQTNCYDTVGLKTIISQIKDIKKGDGISYNREFIANKDLKIAILPIGYADGLSRKLFENQYKVRIQDKLCPIVGVVCMDMIMVDVSKVSVHEGEEVIIFGDLEPKIEDYAKHSETITYDCLTAISPRIRRIYYKE